MCLFPACSPAALFPSECVGRTQKEEEVGFVKEKSFYFVASHTDRCCWERSLDNLFVCFLFANKDIRYRRSFKKNPLTFHLSFSKSWLDPIFSFHTLSPPVGLWRTGGPCNRPSSPGERTHLPPPPLSRSFERRRFVSGLGRTPAEVSAMLRCVLQRANNLRHSDPLAGVVFRGKRILGDAGKTNTGQLVHIRFHSIHCFHM